MSLSYLFELNKAKGWDNSYAASLAEMDIDRYLSILAGSLPINYEDAQKLSILYDMPISTFLGEQTNSTHVNIGQGTYSNSNHGYIHTVTNNSNAGLKELLMELIDRIKS
ncbi:hypothetical protein ACFGVS_00625 [Mucilaginibacter sp. AW1-7]|uniref:hypothetical protein n=1 Tax=Mucilaginibacter sp. AW1-7 TaxID=3349874 RepID=UPI003F73714C